MAWGVWRKPIYSREDSSIITMRHISGSISDHHIISIEPNYGQFLSRQIHRVNYTLRSVKNISYEPLLVTIGPYHHKMDERFKDMESYKELIFQSLCSKGGPFSEKICLAEMEKLEEATRASYASHYRDLGSTEFIRMMALDGCFIVQLFRKIRSGDFDNDPIFGISFIRYQLFRDLVLFENQLPLFVLEKLFKLTKEPADDRAEEFVDLALHVLQFWLKTFGQKSCHLKGCPHLLGLAYAAYVLPVATNVSPSHDCQFEDIRNATGLEEVGVKLRLDKAPDNDGFTFKFTNNRVLEIPRFTILYYTECLMRNFIACEQYSERGSLHRVTDYFIFMDCLIKGSKDVELLRHAGIIANGFGNDEKLSQIFNNITLFVNYDSKNFYYAEISKKLNEYCSKRRNVWRAKLMHNYFNSPWAFASFLGALTLLVLTFVQTIFSVRQKF